jgi:hypothetical protein
MNTLAAKFNIKALRWALLAAVALDLALVLGRALSFPAFFAMPDSALYLLEPVALLLVYAGVAFWLRRIAGPAWHLPLQLGTIVGVCAGALDVVNIVLESLVSLGRPASAISSLSLMFGLFFCWGVAGAWGTRRTGSLLLGMLTAVWSAMVSIVIAVTFGFLLPYAILPRLAHDMTADPDFLRSGWHDTFAFAIANTFDSGFSHLLEAPIIGAIVGALGGMLGKGWQRLMPASLAKQEPPLGRDAPPAP